MIGSQVPPYSYESEVQVIGSLMLDPSGFRLVSENLHIDSFFDLRHKIIFNIILYLLNEACEPDIKAVAYELESQKKLEDAGGIKYISEIAIKVATAANLEYYVAILNEMYVRRKILEVSSYIEQYGRDNSKDALDLLEKYKKELDNITRFISKSSMISLPQLANEFYDTLQKYRNREIESLKTGIYRIDEITGGFYNSDLIIIAGRPSSGKSAMGLTISYNMSKAGVPILFITLEMSRYQTVLRLCSINLEIDGRRLRDGDIDEEENQRVIDYLRDMIQGKLYIEDPSALDDIELESLVDKYIEKNGVRCIFIDYLGMMRSRERAESREKEVGLLSNKCKQIAKKYDIPVVVMVQMNRNVEARRHQIPTLSDLRDSGQIEADADLIMFIDRPEQRGEEFLESGGSAKERAAINVAKNRNGQTGGTIIKYLKEHTLFCDLDYVKKEHRDDIPF